ncbi:tetratricopeptide repeat protein [uncultured Methanospirillum sp.]|uniref:tetratricopeptide repeat protein n=1 Tax=uncultured Methanospirillum sp. TaxID=262503 RepID=UPI0029C837E9|nr:tetratricopeptide repeat protein [uncultured Methanospirillum sp.]
MGTEEKSGQFSRGLRAFKSGDFQTAVEYLSDAVEYDDQNDRAWNALGTACAKIGRTEDADLCFENALTIAPDNPVYLKNKRTNSKHLKNSSNSHELAPKGGILDRIPLDKLPFDKPLLLAGIAIALIIVLGFVLISAISFFTTPAVPPGPGILLSASQNGSFINVTNGGGREINSVASFSWKVNNIPIGTGNPGDPATLGVEKGFTATVPLSTLAGTNLSEGIRVMVIATYKDGSQMLALDTKLQPPSPDLITPLTGTPVPTPTLPPDVPRFKSGDIILEGSKNVWWLVTAPPVNGSYSIVPAARLPNGSFTSLGTTATNVSLKSFEKSGTYIGNQGPGGTPAGLPGEVAPPVTGIPSTHPQPIYPAGDLVNPSPNGETGMMVILGYDHVSDQYQADDIYPYYTGEWGYRTNATAKWFMRPILEERYSHRTGRIATSDVGIGADSAPPRTPVKYTAGDIISPDPAGVDRILVITGYNKSDDRYQIDAVRSAYDGGWKLGGDPIWEKRAFVERDNPYQIRKIDLSLIRS